RHHARGTAAAARGLYRVAQGGGVPLQQLRCLRRDHVHTRRARDHRGPRAARALSQQRHLARDRRRLAAGGDAGVRGSAGPGTHHAAADRLAEYTGWYALSASTRQQITVDGDHLLAQRAGRAPQLLLPESGDVFFTPGRPRTRRIFTRGADGRVNGFADRREGTDLAWTRVETPAPAR